jgi:hypothetical protein
MLPSVIKRPSTLSSPTAVGGGGGGGSASSTTTATTAGTGATTTARMSNTSVVIPFVYGSCAFWLGPQQQINQSSSSASSSSSSINPTLASAAGVPSHKWTLFVRGDRSNIDGGNSSSSYSSIDLSYCIRKVIFQLHPSCAQPLVVVEKYPFEVSQTGWGEFEAIIRIVFKDPNERPVDVVHLLRLYPTTANAPAMDSSSSSSSSSSSLGQEPAIIPVQLLSTERPVVSEIYDEFVFRNPFPGFHNQLVEGAKQQKQAEQRLSHPLAPFWTEFSDSDDHRLITQAHNFVKAELEAASRRLGELDTALQVEFQKQQQQQQEQTQSSTNAVSSTPPSIADTIVEVDSKMDTQ